MSDISLTPDQLRTEKRTALNNVEQVRATTQSIVSKAQGIVGGWDGPAREAMQRSVTQITNGLNKFSAGQTHIAEGLGKIANLHEQNEHDSAASLNAAFAAGN